MAEWPTDPFDMITLTNWSETLDGLDGLTEAERGRRKALFAKFQCLEGEIEARQARRGEAAGQMLLSKRRRKGGWCDSLCWFRGS